MSDGSAEVVYLMLCKAGHKFTSDCRSAGMTSTPDARQPAMLTLVPPRATPLYVPAACRVQHLSSCNLFACNRLTTSDLFYPNMEGSLRVSSEGQQEVRLAPETRYRLPEIRKVVVRCPPPDCCCATGARAGCLKPMTLYLRDVTPQWNYAAPGIGPVSRFERRGHHDLLRRQHVTGKLYASWVFPV